MTAVQLNAEILRKLAAEKDDPTLFTKDEFYARIDKTKEKPLKEFANIKELDQFIKNMN